eukprot:NODE_9630_length_257_cov_84.187500_g8889_i0.p1 GENE.NODE_9630_length_257_cov_84.187500_g8889_i0~~NODE_9630_length_257_cov_84.187500_g8889_i0.p1  ORF type:complete len:60 (-),score=2.92 NODE_9630_length_257_cov_84.187500_g8889_i0:52-231(-)
MNKAILMSSLDANIHKKWHPKEPRVSLASDQQGLHVHLPQLGQHSDLLIQLCLSSDLQR